MSNGLSGEGEGRGSRPQKSRPDSSQQTSSTTAPARALTTTPEVTSTSSNMPPQPAAEPSPTTSPTSSQTRVAPEEERPGELKQMLEDASKMLKTMIANSSTGTSTGSTAPPSYESIQKQLDELRLKAMTVENSTGGSSSSSASSSAVPSYAESNGSLTI